ncbi:MAG TPA: ABATE domain-containing protein [Thermoanaerobaculia bacterium]|jgi:predicted RNA-binding Zn ribbon-like protein
MEQGQPPPAFELSGGALCLDFANTWEDRERPETDKLRGYPDLLAFARQTGLLTADEEARLAGRAERDPEAAAAALALGRGLRETLYRTFSAVADSRAPAAADLERLNAALPEALSRLRLKRQGSELVWAWAAPEDPLEAPLWPILRSAAELLTAAERERVRECAGNACTWLFLDYSRNRSRRWCSMETCGNRAKARRHYRRTIDRDDCAAPRDHGA